MDNYQFIPYTTLLWLSSLCTTALAVYGYLNRQTRGAKPFIASMLVGTIWSLFNSLEMSAMNLPTKLIWANLQYVSYAFAPVCWFLMVLQFTGHEKRITLKTILLLSIIPALTSILVWTDVRWGLVRHSFSLDSSGAFPVIIKSYGPWFWLHFLHCYALNAVSLVLLIRTLTGRNRIYLKQASFLFYGIGLIILTNILYILGFSPFPQYDVTPVVFVFSAFIFAWGIFRYNLFHLVPVARDLVFEKMAWAAVVTDREGTILDMNARVADMFPDSRSIAVPGKNIAKVIPELSALEMIKEAEMEYPETETPLKRKKNRVINLEKQNTSLVVSVNLMPIYDLRKRLAAWVFTIEDVTERTKAQVRMLKQQKELAVWDEQQRVSRDLHDSLGQSLSFSVIQVQTIIRELEKGQIEKTAPYLARLKEVLDQSHRGLREYVLNLRSPQLIKGNFWDTLNEEIQNAGKISSVEITVLPPESPEDFPKGGEMKAHLLNFTKEAINNALKHGNPTEIDIGAIQSNGTWRYFIQDNGSGIRKDESEKIRTGSGLKIMGERAILTGGEFQIESIECGGTRVSIVYYRIQGDNQ